MICTRIVGERNLEFIVGRRCLKRRKLQKIKRLFLRRGNSSLTVRILHRLDISVALFEVGVSQILKVSDEIHPNEKALTPAEKTPSSEAHRHAGHAKEARMFCQVFNILVFCCVGHFQLHIQDSLLTCLGHDYSLLLLIYHVPYASGTRSIT